MGGRGGRNSNTFGRFMPWKLEIILNTGVTKNSFVDFSGRGGATEEDQQQLTKPTKQGTYIWTAFFESL